MAEMALIDPPRETIGFSQASDADYLAWRDARKVAKELKSGIKKKLPLSKLRELAVEARYADAELRTLIEANARAEQQQPVADRLPAEEKRQKELQAAVERMEKSFEADMQQADWLGQRKLEIALFDARWARDNHCHGPLNASRCAVQAIEQARNLGIY
jgi:hypothetical protein